MQNKILLVLVVVLLAASISEARRRKNKGNRADRCIYKRDKSLGKPECIKGNMTFTLQLKSGPDNCTATIEKTKRCRNKECKYDVISNECNTETNKMVKVMRLKEGLDETKCEKEITLEKRKCRNKADKAAKKAARRERNKARKANKKAGRKGRKHRKNKGVTEGKLKCIYKPGPWDDCDETTDTMAKILTLTSGDPSCPPTKVMRKSCRKSCQYRRSKWGRCDPSTGLRERQDRIKPNSARFCAQYRTLTKKCKRSKKRNSCKYSVGDWGPCDLVTNKRTKVLTLVRGNAIRCKPTREIKRLCSRPDGKERCFFGQWRDWEGCLNGVQKKQREVLQGGEDCQKRAVRTRAC